jgi:hypothetical protein
MKDVVSLRDSHAMSSTFESAIRAENTFDLQRLNEFVVGIIDRMVLALFARCYKSREGSPRVALIVSLDAVRALQIERNRKRSTATSKTRRASETSRYADLAKFLGITVPPCLAFLVLHSNQSLSLSNGIEPNGRNDFSNAMLFAFCNDNGKLVFKIEKVTKRGNAPSLE